LLTDSEKKEIYTAVVDLIAKKEPDDAAKLVQKLLDEDPNDGVALNFYGLIHLEASHNTEAYQFFRRALQERPDFATIWLNFGLAAHELNRNDEAIKAYLKAADIDNNFIKAYVNAAAIFIEESRWDDAEKSCNIALDIDPENSMAQKNLAHVYLAKHKWKEGWAYWEKSLGSKFRKEWSYGNEPRWDGSKLKAVVIYGEQGLGDEIMYASCIPDAIKDCKKVIIDCDPRLAKLFKRSFPKADVYGTRRDAHPEWLKTARIDARAAMASLPSIYRNSDESFPGTPYLKADPELRKMWRALFDSYSKPVYGLTLKGGSKITGIDRRTIEPEQFSPLFAKDAIFVSLEYMEEVNHPKIKNFHWATQKGVDFDLTASLIAELDAVIGINTTAHLAADALGVPTHTIVPTCHDFRHEGPNLWSKTNKSYLQAKDENWREVIKRIEL
jgi:Tfp pilus assembly protein PilF